MPTTVTTFGSDEISIRYKEDFFTEKANRKLLKIVPRGLYAGFTLSTSGVADTVTVVADADGAHSAQYQGADFDLTILRTGGDFTLAIPTTGDLYYVAMVASYALGTTTAATIQLFTEAEWAALSATQRSEYLVLGQVLSQSPSAIIPAADITSVSRDFPWDNMPEGAKPWVRVSRNGSFEDTDLAGTYAQRSTGWEIVSGSDISSDYTDADSRTGANSFELVVDNAAATDTEQFALTQAVGIPVIPGQRVYLRFYFRKVLATNDASAELDTSFLFLDSDRGLSGIVGGASLGIHGLSVSAGFDYVYETEVVVPAGAAYFYSFSVGYDDLGSASTGAILRIDDVDVYVEPLLEYSHQQDMTGGVTQTSRLYFQGLNFSDGPALVARLSGTPGIDIGRRDGDDTSATQPSILHSGSLELGAGLNHADGWEQPRAVTGFSEDPVGGLPLGGGTYTLQQEYRLDGNASGVHVRQYIGGDGEIFWTHNAVWESGVGWTRDNNALNSVLYGFSPIDRGEAYVLFHNGIEPDTWSTWTGQRYAQTENGIFYTPEGGAGEEIGVLVEHEQGPFQNFFSFYAGHQAENNEETTFSQIFTFDFTATADEIDLTGVPSAGFRDYFAQSFALIRIITPAAQAGFYLLHRKDTSGGSVATLRTLNGAAPTFPAVGSGTASLMNSVYFGLLSTTLDTNSGVGTVPSDMYTAAVINAPIADAADAEDLTALVLTAPDHGSAHFIRAFQSLALDPNDAEVFRLDNFGKIHTLGGISMYGSLADLVFEDDAAGILYASPKPVRTTQIMPWEGTPIRTQTNVNEPWQAVALSSSPTEGYALQSQEIFGRWFCSLSERLPEGARVTEIRAYVDPGAAYGAGNEMELSWFEQTTDYNAGAAVPTFDGPNNATVDDGTGDIQQLVITGLNIVIDRPGSTGAPADTYAVQVLGGNGTGDRLYGIEIVWEDPGPRNY